MRDRPHLSAILAALLAAWPVAACSSTEGSASGTETPGSQSDVETGTHARPEAGTEVGTEAIDAGDAGDATPLEAACTPGFDLEIAPGVDPKVFEDAVADPETLVRDVGLRVCKILYRDAAQVRTATHLTLLLDDEETPAWKAGDGAQITVMISTRHLAKVKTGGGDVRREIEGILHHEMAHMYQNDDKATGEGTYPKLANVIEGVADFVRIRAGFPPPGAAPTKTGTWDSEGYWKPAFFLLWIDRRHPDFLHRMNLGMRAGDGIAWSPATFEAITGESVDTLWGAYAQAACCAGTTQTCCR